MRETPAFTLHSPVCVTDAGHGDSRHHVEGAKVGHQSYSKKHPNMLFHPSQDGASQRSLSLLQYKVRYSLSQTPTLAH
jgi:hypothetical protein